MAMNDLFFSKRLDALKELEAQLVANNAFVRQNMTQAFKPMEQYCHVADQVNDAGHQAVQFVTAHPLLIGVAVAAMFRFSPRRMIQFGAQGFGVFRSALKWHGVARRAINHVSTVSRFLK